jgi:hypothetical protein
MVSKLLKRLANRSASSSGEGGPLAEQTAEQTAAEQTAAEQTAELQPAEQTAELQTAELQTAELESLSLKSPSRPGPPASPLPSAWVRMHVWRRDRGGCVRCGSRERVWFDHVVPPWEGGAITEENIRLLCESCRRYEGASGWGKRRRA